MSPDNLKIKLAPRIKKQAHNMLHFNINIYFRKDKKRQKNWCVAHSSTHQPFKKSL